MVPVHGLSLTKSVALRVTVCMLAGTLVMVKCTVPALFVILSAAIAIPLDEVLTDMMRESTEQIAGGALIVTYAFELTKGYQLRMADGKGYDKWKVCMSMLGTVISAQLHLWPFHHLMKNVLIKSRWVDRVSLDPSVVQEIRWWHDKMKDWSGKPIDPSQRLSFGAIDWP